MRLALALGIAALMFVGCDRRTAENEVQVANDDPRLVESVKEAKRHWPEFVAAFKKATPSQKFYVKIPLPVRGGGDEHLWLQVESLSGETISGMLANDPIGDLGLKLGDKVEVKSSVIEDWMYNEESGKMVGRYSEKMMKEVRKEQGSK